MEDALGLMPVFARGIVAVFVLIGFMLPFTAAPLWFAFGGTDGLILYFALWIAVATAS